MANAAAADEKTMNTQLSFESHSLWSNRPSRVWVLFAAVALLVMGAAPSAFSQAAPKYSVSEIVPRPAGFDEEKSDIRYVGINAQGYVLFEYYPDRFGTGEPGRARPLVYKGNGEFVECSLSGLPASGNVFGTQNISDVASDGSFRVIASFNTDLGRPVIWTVSAGGTVSAQVLKNLVLPPESLAPGEQPDARGLAVNSAGVVVGDGTSHRAGRGLRWFTPDPTAQIFPESMIYDTAFDIDEEGNYIRSGQESGTVLYNGTFLTFPASDAFANIAALRGGRAIGEYSTSAVKGTPYLYSAATGSIANLPKYVDPERTQTASEQKNFPKDLNAAGDIAGENELMGNGFEFVNSQLLWKRLTDGTYRVYPLTTLIEDPAATPSLRFSNASGLKIAADGTLVAEVSFNFQKRRVVMLKPKLPKPGPPLPATTGFTVNDSSTGFAVQKDSVLRMRVTQPSTAARLVVRVQTSTDPGNEASWTDLNNGSFGRMIFDVTKSNYVLNTTTYPRVANVHFRAISRAAGNSDSISNVVGPFDLTSSAQHLGRTILSATRNGVGAVINFRGFDETHPSGVSMRVQSSTSPGDESNWADLPDGNGGKMAPYRNPGDFYLDSKNYPANGAVYFRVVASAPGFVDSPSRGVGPFNLINSPSPTVTVTAPAQPGDFLGGDFQSPQLLPAGPFMIGAKASPNGGPAVKSLGLIFDGETVDRFDAETNPRFDPASGNSRSYTAAAGDHVVEAFALDDLNVTGDSVPVYVRIAPANGRIFNRVADGAWSDATRWLDQSLANGVPGPNDFANLGTYNVTIPQGENITALAVALHGGSIKGDGALTITGTFTVSKGTVSLLDLTIAESGTLLLVNEEDIPLGGTVNNNGSTKLIGRAGITGIPESSGQSAAMQSGAESVRPDNFFKGAIAFFKNLGDLVLGRRTGGKREARPAPQPVPEAPRTVFLDIENGGNIISGGAGNIISGGAGNLIGQDGAGLIGQDGAGIISSDGASIISSDGASLIGQDGAGILGDGGSGIISGGGGNIISGGAGNIISGGAGNSVSGSTSDGFSTQGSQAAATGASVFRQTGGSVNLKGIRLTGPVILNGGVLQGHGTIDGDLTNDGGFIAPGNSTGVIGVTGNFTQTANGALLLELGGTNSYIPEFDQLKIGGSAALGGKVSVKTINGFTPDSNVPLVPLSYASATGAFASTSGNVQLDLRDTGAALAVVGPNPPAPKLLNISTRMRVETGDNALIGGFIITGSAAKKVLLRAIGPSLADSGVVGALANPTLELNKPDGSTVFNDNWKENETEVRATTIPPPNDLESAIVVTLQPGFYTAVVRGLVGGQPNGAGVALVEAYDLDGAQLETLANISTRGLVQTGENVMIGGFIVGGTVPAKILVRAIGPSLADQGVSGALQDPVLEVVDRNGNTISNDDWRATQEAEIIATTVPPRNSRESAIVATLVPGSYTAIVRGKGETTGIALVEAYNLQ